MIMMNCDRIISIMFAFISLSASEKRRTYKISMVSSDSNPSRPAMFEHGASPVWDEHRQCLYFVDVHSQNLHRLDYGSGKIFTKHIDYGQVNLVVPVSGTRRLLISVRSSLYLLDWGVRDDSALRLLVTLDVGLPDNVATDGKADSEGRLWVGTKGPQIGDDILPDRGTFYSIEQESFTRPRIHLRPVTYSNGLAWSPNNSVLYYTDSHTQKIEAFDFDAMRGLISARRTIADITLYGYEESTPAGMAIDSNGCLWVAIMYGGTVLHIDPDTRKVLYGYKLPVTRATSVAWGGPHLDELFVTTARGKTDEPAEPYAGSIFTIRDTGSVGQPVHTFRFDGADSY